MRYRKPLPIDVGRNVQVFEGDEDWTNEILDSIVFDSQGGHCTLVDRSSCFAIDCVRVPMDTTDEQAQLYEAADWFAERGQDVVADWLMKIAGASTRVLNLVSQLIRETGPCASWNCHPEANGRVRYSATFGSLPEFHMASMASTPICPAEPRCGVCGEPAQHTRPTANGAAFMFLCAFHYQRANSLRVK